MKKWKNLPDLRPRGPCRNVLKFNDNNTIFILNLFERITKQHQKPNKNFKTKKITSTIVIQSKEIWIIIIIIILIIIIGWWKRQLIATLGARWADRIDVKNGRSHRQVANVSKEQSSNHPCLAAISNCPTRSFRRNEKATRPSSSWAPSWPFFKAILHWIIFFASFSSFHLLLSSTFRQSWEEEEQQQQTWHSLNNSHDLFPDSIYVPFLHIIYHWFPWLYFILVIDIFRFSIRFDNN